MKIPSVARLGVIAAVFFAVVAIAAPLPFRLDSISAIDVNQSKQVLEALRKRVRDRVAREDPLLPKSLRALEDRRVTGVLTAWSRGKRHHVFQVENEPLKGAFSAMVRSLDQLPERVIRDPRFRLQIDMVNRVGWVPAGSLFGSLAFVEGRQGMSGVVGDRRVYLPPTEFIRKKRYGSFRPLPGYDKRFRVGVSVEKLKKTLLSHGRRLGVSGESVGDLERFACVTVVEGEDLVPRRLFKSTVARGKVTRERVEAAVLAGASYLSRTLKRDGMFHYHYNPVRDRDESGRYNWPRHAGVVYSLALVGRILQHEESIETAQKALVRFEKQLTDGPDRSKCLMANGKCYLGSSALGLLALAEYRLASGDPRFDNTARDVAKFMVAMRQGGRLFYHDWYPKKGVDRELEKLYASSQAVFALARYAKAFADKGALDVAQAGMDYLAGPFWDHFLGSYFFGLEHWTCLAAEEVYNARPNPAYAKLCHGIGTHYDNITHKAGETPFVEDVGGMSITHVFTPHVGGTATALEAMVSAVVLGDAAGLETASMRQQLLYSFGYFIQTQVTAHDTFWIPKAAYAVGGFYEMQSKTRVRIDNVQHTISAMVRGLEFIDARDPSYNPGDDYDVHPSQIEYPKGWQR